MKYEFVFQSVADEAIVGRPKFIEKRDKLRSQKLYKSQESIDVNTIQYLNRLKESEIVESIQFHLEQFNRHLQEYPIARILANKKDTPKVILSIQREHPQLLELTSEVLARLGYHANLTGSKGIRILSIDGGGMKGVIALEVLR